MEEYSYSIFFLVLFSLSAAALVTIEAVRSFECRRFLYSLWCVSSLTALILFPLALLSPWPRVSLIFRVLAYPAAAPALVSSAMILRVSLSKRPPDLLLRYRGAIIDSLREGIVIFDPYGRVISFGQENPLPDHLIRDRVPSIPPDHPFGFLDGLLAAPSDSSGTLRDGVRTLYWRFKPLPEKRGSLLTLLDISREQDLADSLQRTGEMLTKRRRLLLSLEPLDAETRAVRIREHISGEIDRKIRCKLSDFLAHANAALSLADCLAIAEDSLADVRRLVRELSPYREGV